MREESGALVERLYEAFNRRDLSEISALCDEEMEFFPLTGRQAGRTEPYAGPTGLREYLDDVSGLWEELLVTPTELERRRERLLVRGRVYLRSHKLGIRDLPAAWIWELRGDRFLRGEVFADPDEAVLRFDAEAGEPGEQPDHPRRARAPLSLAGAVSGSRPQISQRRIPLGVQWDG